MEYQDALNTILMHGIGRNDVPLDEALHEHGFIGCLRPWSGLRDENYRELMRAILSLRESLKGRPQWPKELIAGIMGITRMAHCWALDDQGMLRRNGLITGAELDKLRQWVRRIESVVEQLLLDRDPLEAFSDLKEILD